MAKSALDKLKSKIKLKPVAKKVASKTVGKDAELAKPTHYIEIEAYELEDKYLKSKLKKYNVKMEILEEDKTTRFFQSPAIVKLTGTEANIMKILKDDVGGWALELDEYNEMKENGNGIKPLNSKMAKGGEVDTYEVELSAVPNPDYADDNRGSVKIKKSKKKVSDIEEAKKVVREFIEKNELGGGNWPNGGVYKNGKKIGYISYNGKFWPENKMADGGETENERIELLKEFADDVSKEINYKYSNNQNFEEDEYTPEEMFNYISDWGEGMTFEEIKNEFDWKIFSDELGLPRSNDYADGGYMAKGGKTKKGDVGKSGTQYGYTLKEYEEMGEKNGLFVSPKEWWSSREGKKYTDSFGRTKTIGSNSQDERQEMQSYGYRIAIGMDLGSDKIPESARKYVIENNFTKEKGGYMADGGMIKGDIVEYEGKSYKIASFDNEANLVYLNTLEGKAAEDSKGDYLKVNKTRIKKMAKGGGVGRTVMIPTYVVKEINDSVKMGYDTIVEGMIGRNRKGVMLINDKYEVRQLDSGDLNLDLDGGSF